MSSALKKVVISEFMDHDAVQTLERHVDIVYDPELVDNPKALHQHIADAQVLIVRNRTRVDQGLLAAAPRLRMVGRLGVGLDNIDLEACKAGNIRVAPATGANTQAVAEYVIASAMMLWRGCFFASGDVAQGGWPRPALSSGREVHGRCLGLVGFGGIGQKVAAMAQALGIQVVAHDPFISDGDPVWAKTGATPSSFDELIAQADIVSLHIPLTPDSRNLFDAHVMAKMKPGSVLINTSRGGIVDEAAVADALKQGRLSGAALDVFQTEPLPASPDLQDVPGLVLTPHVAGVTQESNQRVSMLIADRVIEFLNEE